jgi:hypothetical protein
MQNSVWHKDTAVRRNKCRIDGVIQMREVAGFSKVTGVMWVIQHKKMRHECFRRTFPNFTARRSPVLVSVDNPMGSASDRRAGGPAPSPRMREKVWQGVPICNPRISPARTQPSINFTLSSLVKS